jgi:hypothetical protein
MVVIADPNADNQCFVEADEPGVPMILAGTGFTGDKSASCCASASANRHHAAQER